jgi:sugar phosphate isomerase/epimerase
LDSDDKEFEASLKDVEAVVGVAGKVKARAGILAIPASTNLASFPQYFEYVRARLQRLANIFESHQVLLGLSMSTFVEDRSDRQYSFVQDVDGALALANSCPSNYVGLLVDTYHWTVGKGTWEQLASLQGSKVAGLNIADMVAIPSLNESKDSLKFIAGTYGIVDNAQFAKILAENGYDGPITSSPSPKNLGSITRDSIVSKAQDVLDATLAAANLSTQTRRPEWIAAQASSGPEINSIEELG